VRMDDLAKEILSKPQAVLVGEQVMAEIDGRSGLVAVQKA